MRIKPDHLPARLNLANVLWQAGRPAEAEAEYRTVLQLQPDDPFALYNLGALLAGQGR
jgi:Flp pilus assembly protein TadD